MGQEFFIKDDKLEDKIRELLPSQGGLGQGFDLSASTQIIPIVDLTESAQGSNLRGDLQTSFGLKSEVFSITGATTTILTTTGYFRIFGIYKSTGTSNVRSKIQITDGVTTKDIYNVASAVSNTVVPFDFNIFLDAGQSCVVVNQASAESNFVARQIATINGELVNP